MVLSFFLGVEQGKIQSNIAPVVFSCSEEVLSATAISSNQKISPLSDSDGEEFTLEPTVLSAQTTNGSFPGKYLGSKNGTKYYTPGCSGARRINPENYVWFIDEEDATLQGYTAASC